MHSASRTRSWAARARCGSKCLRQPSAPGPRMTLILRRVAARVLAILRRVAARVLAYNAYWGASTKNRSKANPKSLRNRPQNGPKSVPNRSKIGPRSASEPTSLPTSILDRFGTVFGPFSDRFGSPCFGALEHGHCSEVCQSFS